MSETPEDLAFLIKIGQVVNPKPAATPPVEISEDK